jgi:hypothetical protein
VVKSGLDARIYRVNSIPVSWLASDGGLTADLFWRMNWIQR